MPFRKFLLITGFLILSTVGIIQLLALDSDLITPQQISTIYTPDYDINGARVSQMDSVVSGETVHIVWQEDSIADSSGQDFDVFYRQLPNGVTTNLSIPFPDSHASVRSIVAGEDNNVCILWIEQSNSDTNDKRFVLWNSAQNVTSISPQVNVFQYGFSRSQMPEFNCSSTESARVVWPANDDVFLWDTDTNLISNLSNNDNFGLLQKVRRIDVGDKIYLAWSYHSMISLWNSESNIVEEVPNVVGWNFELVKDNNDIVHLFRQESLGQASAGCWSHWDSASETHSQFTPCEADVFWDAYVASDDEGNIHVAWAKDSTSASSSVASYEMSYWNLTTNTLSTVTTDLLANSGQRIILVGGKDNTAHIFWQADYTDDYYYWNSNDEQQIKMNDTPQEDNGYLKWLQWELDSEGKIHAVWSSSSDSTTKIHYWGQDLPSLTTIYGPLWGFLVDQNDVVHILFASFDGLKHWNDQGITSQHVTSSPVLTHTDELGVDIVDGPFDEILVFFNTTPESISYWNETEGETVLGSGDDRFYEYTESGKFYMYWDGDHGRVYAAWNEDEAALPPASDNKEIFLPFVKK